MTIETNRQTAVAPIRWSNNKLTGGWTRRLGKFVCLMGFVAAIGAISLHWVSNVTLYFDFLNNLTLHYALAAAAFAVGFFMPRARVLTAFMLIVLGMSAIAFWPHYVSGKPVVVAASAKNERALRVMTFNTWSDVSDWASMVKEIERQDPDIVALMEIDEEKYGVIAALKKRYPYSSNCIRKHFCHLALLSKHQLSDVRAQSLWKGPVHIRARLGKEFGGTYIFGIHSTRPPHVRSQIVQLATMAQHIKKFKGPKIVMGDFNSTPFATILQNFEKNSGLKRISNLPTYPARFGPFPQLAIDHIFLSDKVRRLSDVRIGGNAKSDHYPLIVDLAVPTK